MLSFRWTGVDGWGGGMGSLQGVGGRVCKAWGVCKACCVRFGLASLFSASATNAFFLVFRLSVMAYYPPSRFSTHGNACRINSPKVALVN